MKLTDAFSSAAALRCRFLGQVRREPTRRAFTDAPKVDSLPP
jgi:hypothetical protein